MLKVSLALLSFFSLASVMSCSGYVDMTEEEMAALTEDVESLEEAACYNPEGVNYTLASLAAATAIELKRWNPVVDFKVVSKYQYVSSWGGWLDVVELSDTGKKQCADGVCANVQAILDFQKKEASGVIKFPGGATLQSDVLAVRLVAGYREQEVCNSRPANRGDSNCPVEEHTLQFSSATPGGCETDYWFHAYKKGTTQALSTPKQLKNQLIMFGSTAGNPYLAFDTQGDDVKVDPGPGTVSKDPATSGACPTLTINSKYSTTNLSGTCCIYGGKQLTFSRSAFNANTYICK